MRVLSIVMFTLLLVAIIAMGSRCNLNRSELTNTDIPIECKIVLELAYFQQKQPDKSAIVANIQACKEAMRFNRCAQYIENRTLWEACNGALK
jgi:hypothetical protein